MASAKYCIDQPRTLLAWARTTTDKAHAERLRKKAKDLLARANESKAAVPDLNPLLAEFNDRQIQARGPDEGAGAQRALRSSATG
jgi:hypothetical protein